jgi:hypothetical protein
MKDQRLARTLDHLSAPRKLAPPALAAFALLACDTSTDPDPDPEPTGPVDVASELVVGGLSNPLFLTAPAGDDRLFVVQRDGQILIVENGAALTAPFLDIGSLVTAGGEQGLLGLAFHPAYATNGYFYVNYTDADDASTQIVRYTASADPNVADEGSALTILSVEQPHENHNGGMLAFGPDGMLYVAMGDGGSGGDPDNHGQRPTTLLGSILRLDVDGGAPYGIPADNPFVGHGTAREEIWAYGLRNPWRFAFDRETGDLYIADVGQSAREEINFQTADGDGGQNYGWNIMEGTACYEPASGCSQSGLALPVHEYTHDDGGCSISGGYVYRGTQIPAADGRYFFADFCRTWVRSVAVSGGVADEEQDHTDGVGEISGIASFGEDGQGELYIVSLDGAVYKLVAPTT